MFPGEHPLQERLIRSTATQELLACIQGRADTPTKPLLGALQSSEYLVERKVVRDE